MKNLVELIVKSIVNTPDDVEVEEKESSDFPGLTIINIKVNPSDLGQVIGKRGRTINAIRDIVTIAAIRAQKRVKVIVREEDKQVNANNVNEEIEEVSHNVPDVKVASVSELSDDDLGI
jgi:predicted RNA-binding protein YlqC (UPF0109 family)